MHGLYVQRPFASSLVHGTKLIETRSYPIPDAVLGEPVYIIETPRRGQRRNGDRGMIIGRVVFDSWKRYGSRDEWLADAPMHLVADGDEQYGWQDGKKKYGWTVDAYEAWHPSHYRGTGYGRVWVTGCESVALIPDVRRAPRS
jgi:hypothetical protein